MIQHFYLFYEVRLLYFCFSMEEEGRGKEYQFLSSYKQLTKNLQTDHGVTTRNINQNTFKLKNIFQELREMTKQLLVRCDQLSSRNKELQRELGRYDSDHYLLQQGKKSSKKFVEKMKEKMNKFTSLDFPMSIQTNQGESALSKSSAIPKLQQTKLQQLQKLQQTPFSRQKYEYQSKRIQKFIRNHLSKNILFNPQNKSWFIEKALIIRIYYKWCQSLKMKNLVKQRLVKLLLTTELKAVYQNLKHNQRKYVGLCWIQNAVKRQERGGDDGRMVDQKQSRNMQFQGERNSNDQQQSQNFTELYYQCEYSNDPDQKIQFK